MNPEQNDPTQPSPEPQAQGASQPATSDGPKYLTADEWKAERNSMFADMRKLVEGVVGKSKNGKANGATESAPTTTETATAPAMDVHGIVRREQEISEALAEHGHLTREQRSVLRKLVDVDKPDDVLGYIANYAKTFGRPSGETTMTNPKPASGGPVSFPAAPSGPPKFTEDTPLWRLSDEDRARLIKEKGLGWYNDTLRKQAKGVRVRVR